MTTPGMTLFRLTNDDDDIAEYEANDLECAQYLAAEDHGGEPDDWEWTPAT